MEFFPLTLSLPHLRRKQFPSTPTIPKIPSWQIPLKLPSAPGSPSVNSSSDISPVSNDSASSSPTSHSHHDAALGGAEGSTGINGDLSPVGLSLKEQVRMEVQGGEEEDEEEVKQAKEEEEDGLSIQTAARPGGDGQINEQVDKLRQPEGASNESEVD